MKIRPVFPTVAVLLGMFLSPIAFAQTIQFNKNFTCNGERQSVASCFDDSDAAGCMVMYPDRPLRGGFTVQEVEKRGDVIKKIQGCVGASATLASTGHPAPAAPRSAPAATTAAAAKPNAPPPPPDPSVAKARAAGVDMTALGLQLGQGFSLPQCQQASIGDAFSAIFGGSTGPPPVYPCSQGQVSQPYSFGLLWIRGSKLHRRPAPIG